MNISEVKRNLGRAVIYDGTEYILTGCIIRRSATGQFYYQAELKDTNAKTSLLITDLESIDERRTDIESKNTR